MTPTNPKRSSLPAAFLCFIFLAVCASAGKAYAQLQARQSDPESDFEIVFYSGIFGAIITNYLGDKQEVVIPSQIHGVPVISIGDGAFNDKRLTSVVIPDSVTYIGICAFANNQLTGVNISNGVTVIGESAFVINQLTSVIIPDSVTTIGSGAFENNRLTSLVIPEGVTMVGRYAFYCNQLTSVAIPDSVTSVGEYAFWLNRLTSVTIGANVSLGSEHVSAFEDGFEEAYDKSGRAAGTYVKSVAGSDTWIENRR